MRQGMRWSSPLKTSWRSKEILQRINFKTNSNEEWAEGEDSIDSSFGECDNSFIRWEDITKHHHKIGFWWTQYPRCSRKNARTVDYITACPHEETHERESIKEFAAEQYWEQLNDVANLLESADAMRKPKSGRSVAKLNPNLAIPHSSKEEFHFSLKENAKEETWRNIDMVEILGVGRRIKATAPF